MKHILLLEPDVELGRIYEKSLSLVGYEVALCHTAQAAISKMDQQKPDIIITELRLAMHNGVEFLYELRSYTEWQDIKVIVLSNVPATERESLGVLWRQLKISAYHYKPLTKLQDLVGSVNRVTAAESV